MNYYANTILEIKAKLTKEDNLTKDQWNEYKKGKSLFSAESVMWIYCETENWDVFINKLKKEIE